MELLPYDLVEDILQRFPVKSLLRFTSVSRLWNSTIKSKYFASKHLIRAQSRNPDILLCGAQYDDDDVGDSNTYPSLSTLTLGSSDSEKIHILPKSTPYDITVSCDGLVCAYNLEKLIYVINPATRWHRKLPQATLQQVNRLRLNLNHEHNPIGALGFGKDTSTSNYKLVWLYNYYDEFRLGPSYTCEVFDFNTNTWRYVTFPTHASLYRGRPVYAHGSLYWLTLHWFELSLLSFDLRTEVFQARQETPIVHAFPHHVNMSSLNSRLCMSETKLDESTQEIWTLNTDKTWEKTFTINIGFASIWFGKPIHPATPVAIFDQEKLLLRHDKFAGYPGLVVQDTRRDSSCLYLKVVRLDRAVSYFPSLISI